jgi:D-tyrosyl-tRNA(Tyr) deacylase
MEAAMRAVVQRVRGARVEVEGRVTGAIDRGLLVLIGAAPADTPAEVDALAEKIACLRIFPDGEGKMNLDVTQVSGAVLAVSQFTLFGDCRKGRRPSFQSAAGPEHGDAMYTRYVESTRRLGLRCETGVFGAMMDVHLLNDGPVTLLLDTTRLF